MPIPLLAPLPLLVPLFAAGGGFIAGALSRQPEINRLKQQVRTLQAEIVRLQGIVQEQDRQVNELKIRYKQLKAFQFSERERQAATARGAIIHQYCFVEYVDLLCAQTRGHTLTTAETRFFNIYEGLLENNEFTTEAVLELRDFIMSKYGNQIKNLIAVDSSRIFRELEATNVA